MSLIAEYECAGGENMKLFIIGDSLVTGYGVPQGKSWLDHVLLSSKEPMENKGRNGDTTADLLYRLSKDVLVHEPDTLFILAGTNDALSGKTANIIYNNVQEIIRQCIHHSIVPIVILPPFLNIETASKEDPSLSDAFESYANILKRYRRLIEDYCMDERIDVIDFNKAFVALDVEKDPFKYYLDGIHFTPYAHKKLADKFLYKYNHILVHKNPTDYIISYDRVVPSE